VKRTASIYRFSPSDLINYVRSEFITWMERWYLDHPSEAEPDPESEEMQIIQNKGIEHERDFLAALKTAGRGVTDFDGQKEHLQATVGVSYIKARRCCRRSARQNWPAFAHMGASGATAPSGGRTAPGCRGRRAPWRRGRRFGVWGRQPDLTFVGCCPAPSVYFRGLRLSFLIHGIARNRRPKRERLATD
jgi:hypothetical protein